MTSATSPSKPSATRSGFTLVEILVVIGIIVVLAGILLPTVLKAYRQAGKTRAAADLQTIGMGLEAYKQDFTDYPRPDPADASLQRGAILLCRALIAPDSAAVDGLDGPGFKIRVGGGKPYGPYLKADAFKVISSGINCEIAGRSGAPILYFAAASRVPNIAMAGNYIANAANNTTSQYNYFDNSAIFTFPTKFAYMLGDINADGAIGVGETAVLQPYLLWDAGDDGVFGPMATSPTKTDYANCDDATNFPR
jgi:prepilin-type N-terminal cleavage/methylation domain-containing protein